MNEILSETSEQTYRIHPDMPPSEAFVQYLREYARERPEVVALWCFGIGFVLGWKLKPW